MKKQVINKTPIIFSIFLFSILFLAFGFRVFRLDQLLGFYYDQGRDALVIWDLIHNGKFFLIGPTTGIEGIFRGPWYYWLITPFYLLGNGNPVWPAVFLALTTTVAIYFLYKVALQVGNKTTAFIAVIIASFSYYLILAARWLSNPTPMFLISILFIYSLFKILEGKKLYWVLVGFLSGMAMQFGSATEIFYFPIIALVLFWQRKNLPSKKVMGIAILALILGFLPQIIFDLRHDGILRNNIYKFIFEKGSFNLSFWQILQVRLPFYYEMIFSKIFPQLKNLWSYSLLIFTLIFVTHFKPIMVNKKKLLIMLIFFAPLLGMLFFQGNEGNVYDYYFTGYYLVYILFISMLLGMTGRYLIGKILIIAFLALFLKDNLPLARNFVTSGVDGPSAFYLGNQKQAIDWIYNNANDKEFNIDVYVPPVIPYSYNYLFKWYGGATFGKEPKVEQIPLLYTLYEFDPPHPERLEVWLDRQKGIGKTEEEARFGGIVVQKRTRI